MSDVTPEILRRLAALEELTRQPQAEAAISGLFTPSLVGATTPGTFTYDVPNTGGQYTLSGDFVFFNLRARITAVAVAPVGILTLDGFPFVAVSGGFAIAGGASFGAWTGITLTAGYTQVGGDVINGTTGVRLLQSGSAVGAASLTGASFALVAGVADFRCSGVYRVA